MKIIGINIDGVLRDKLSQFDKMYRKKYIKNDEYYNFINQDYVFEIYGSAPPIAKAMDKANKLQKIGEVNGKYEIVLFSHEKDQAIQATYHFLAKSACRIKKIIFENDMNRVWDYCDLVITDNPEFIESKPDNKISIKIKADYNSYDKADYEFNSLTEVEDTFFINLIKENIL